MRTRTLILAGLIAVGPVFAAESAKPGAKLAKADAKMPAKPGNDSQDPTMMMGEMSGEPMMMMSDKGGEFTPEQLKFFHDKIQPILANNCYKCHSAADGKTKGGLTLDTRDGWKKGGDTGPAIRPGDPKTSLLIQAITYKDPELQMPPKSTGGKMSDEDIALLTEWVKMGAPDPRKEPVGGSKLTGLTDKARQHWAYQPVKKPAVPAVKNRGWCVTPIDAFILEKMEAKNMFPSPLADRETLIRRAYFDLIGLPPSPKEIEAFVNDTSGDIPAFAKVVDRLLASPHYGERWGRYWLDTARYSDTVGGDRNADNRAGDYRYPFAWTYRDWVIKAFNDDMPYDQFIMHQLAADQIPNNDTKNLAALGFITVGERFNNNNDIINDRIDVVTKGFLAMTVSCARCHDHMFDPIPTTDYYALHGVFSSITEPTEKPLINKPDPAKMQEFEKQVSSLMAADRAEFYKVLENEAYGFRQKPVQYMTTALYRRHYRSEKYQQLADKMSAEEKLDNQLVAFVYDRMNNGGDRVFGPMREFMQMPDGDYDFLGAKKCNEIAENKGNRWNPLVASYFRGVKPNQIEDIIAIYGKIFSLVNDQAKEMFAAYAQATDGKPSVDPARMELAAAPFSIRPANELDTETIRQMVRGWPQQMANRARFNFAKINELLLTHGGAPARAMVVADRSNPRNSAVMIRGQADNRGPEVPRRFLEILSPGHKPKPFTKGSGRLELAQSIADKRNPLTARVMVNRVWMHHFGEGFVRTPDDLGTQAELPSHPELLDWLADYFMEQNWSLKKLHKAIMLSRVYQISSHTRKEWEQVDPENRLLWRANVRRLDFESMRDSLLVMANKLDPGLTADGKGLRGGQPVNLTDEPYSHRRSVYGYVDRGNLPELMAHFDFSDPDMPNSKRSTTIVPQQALFFMNSPFVVDVARSIMSRPEVLNARDDMRRIFAIYKIIFQRTPKPHETATAAEYLRLETKHEAETMAAAQEIVEKASKSLEERKKRRAESAMRNDGLRAIQNQGEFVERKPLTVWETFVQALLLSNETAYVN